MRKKALRILCIIVALAITVAPMAGCKKREDRADVLYIHINRAGNGDAFVYKLADKFTEIYGNEVKIDSTTINDLTRTKLTAGPKNNNVDLFMAIDQVFDLIAMGPNAMPGYPSIFAELTDVYESNGYGTDVKVKDFMQDQAYEYYTVDGKQWAIPYICNTQGLVYNAAIFEDCGITKEPRTTDELIEVCETLKSHGKLAFTYAGKYDYWRHVYTAWWAQYEGMENIEMFFEGRSERTGEYSVDCYKQPGRLYALQALESLITPDKGYADRNANTYEFTQAQVNYLEGAAAMMPNGDWLENEMKANFGDDDLQIKMMRTPVLSKLGEKLGISEQELRDAIDYVDGVTQTKPGGGVSDEDLDAIEAARFIACGGAASAQAFIPVYSNAIDLAKDFLRLMYSPTGAEIYMQATGGIVLPVEYDYTDVPGYDELSVFQKSKLKITERVTYVDNWKKYPMFYAGGLQMFQVDSGCLEKNLGTNSAQDRKTAKDLYNADIEYYTQRWGSIMSQAGVSND